MSWTLRTLSSRFILESSNRHLELAKSGKGQTACLSTQNHSIYHHPSQTNQPERYSVQALPRPSQVTVILPVYNEQTCINGTFDAVQNYARTHPNYDFIFISDGSTDRTPDILERQIGSAQTNQIQLLAYDERGGKGYAVRRGIEVAEGQYICFLDGDLAYSLDHLDRMVAKLADFDVVIGSRHQLSGVDRGLKPSRKVAGKIFNSLSKRILNLPYVDMQMSV